MGVNSNKAFLVSFSSVLDKVSSKRTLTEIKGLMKEQIIKLRPEMDTKAFKKDLDKMIKDGMKNAQFTLDKKGRIKTFATTVSPSPSEQIAIAMQEKKRVPKHVDVRTGKDVLNQPAHMETTGVEFKATAMGNVKLYENATKKMIALKKQMTDAEISGNTKGRNSLKKDLIATVKQRMEYKKLMKQDQSTETYANTIKKAGHDIEQAGITNTNKLMKAKTTLINGHVKAIKQISIAQKDMNKGDAGWAESVKQIREHRKEITALVGDNKTLNDVRQKGYQSIKQSVGESEVKKYSKAAKERLVLDKEIGTLSDKMGKNASDRNHENNQLLTSLSAQRTERTKTMQSIETSSKGQINEVAIAKERLKYDNAHNIVQEKINAGSAKTKNFLRDIMSGWKDAAARVIDYTIAYRALWGGVALIKSGIQTIYDLNKAFTDIQMVTGMTTMQVNILADSYAKLAQDYGATIQQVAQGATEWLRQGKSVEDTTSLLQQSMIMSKVGAVDSAKATEYLTSTLNGYKMEAKDASKIVDAFSALDMAAATSTEELAIAFQRSANSAHDSGISFEKLASYITVVSETTRKSASTIGESFKTLSARFMNVKLGIAVDPESGENINDTEKALKTVGIAIRDSKNTWRDFEDVIDEVGAHWGDYNEMQKNTIVTAMAGVRQAENFRALMNNFPKVGKYMEVVANSAGTAAEKYESYMNSLEAKQNKLISTFQQIAYQPGWIALYKTILDLGSALGALGNIVSNNAVSMGALSAAIAIVVLTVGKFKNVAFTSMLETLRLKALYLIDTLFGVVTVENAMTASAIRAAFASKAMMFALSPLGLVAIALGIGVAVKAFDEFTLSTEEAVKKAEDLTAQYEALKEEVSTLTLKTDAELSPDEIARLAWLKEYQKTLEDAVKIANSDAAERLFFGSGDWNPFTIGTVGKAEAKENVSNPNDAMANYYKNANNVDINSLTQTAANKLTVPQLANVQKQYDDLIGTQSDLLASQEAFRNELKKPLDAETIAKLRAELDKTEKKTLDNESALNKLRNFHVINVDIVETTTKEVVIGTSVSVDTAVSEYTTTLTDIEKAQDKVTKGQSLSYEEMSKLREVYPQLTSAIKKTKQGWTIEINALNLVKKTARETALEQIKAEKDKSLAALNGTTYRTKLLVTEATTQGEFLKKLFEGQRIVGGSSGVAMTEEQKALMSQYNSYQDLLEMAKQAALEISDLSTGEIGGGSDTAAAGADKWVALFDDAYAKLQDQRDSSEISEAKYLFDLDILNKKYYAHNKKYIVEYAKYHSEIKKGEQGIWKETYDKQLSYSKKYMDAHKDEWANGATFEGDSEISALLRIKKAQEAYYADAKINHKMYLADIKQDLDETNLAIEEKVKELVSNLKDVYAQSLLDKIQAQIDKLENKRLNDSVISGLESQIAIETDRLKLLNAQADAEAEKTAEIRAQKELIDSLSRQKDIRVYRANKGWTYEQDKSKIAAEKSNLGTMEAELQKAQIQKIIDKLQDKLDDVNKKYDDQIKVLQKNLDNQTYLYNLNKDKVGPTIEKTLTELDKLGIGASDVSDALLEWINKLRADMGLPPIVPPPTTTPAAGAVDASGNAPAGTAIGTIIPTAGGDYKVVAPNTPGAKYNPANGLWSLPVSGSKSATGSSTVAVDNSGNASKDTKIGTTVVTAGGSFKVVPPNTTGAKLNPASGLWSVKVNDEGGLNTGKGMMLKNIISPERVLSPTQTQDFGRLVAYLPKIIPTLDMFNIGNKLKPSIGGSTDNSISIQNLTIQAPNGATLESLLNEARNLSKINKK